MTEADLMRRLLKSATGLDARLFRNNTAQAWVGDVRRNADGSITIRNPRPLHAGLCVGSSDLIGWMPVDVTSDMVGRRIAVFTAVEVKTERGRTSEEQRRFIAAVQGAGGYGGVARHDQDLAAILRPSFSLAQRVDKIATESNDVHAQETPVRLLPK